MAKPLSENRAQPSILDRLLDDDPSRSQDPFISPAQTIRNYRAAVRRDIEALFNTRCSVEEAPEGMEEAQRSLYGYGLRDFTHLSVTSARHRQDLSRMLQRALEFFEPRLLEPNVTVVESKAGDRRTVTFHITAMLHLDPAPEPVSFDTTLEVTSGDYSVTGGNP